MKVLGVLILYGLCVMASSTSDTNTDKCPPTQPFRCPGISGPCISLQYMCDGSPDCPDEYDEDHQVCVAYKRPPTDETETFLRAFIKRHGADFFKKMFGSKAGNSFESLGGIEKVANALSVIETLEDFGKALEMTDSDMELIRTVFTAVENHDSTFLKSLGLITPEISDFELFFGKFLNSGFWNNK